MNWIELDWIELNWTEILWHQYFKNMFKIISIHPIPFSRYQLRESVIFTHPASWNSSYFIFKYPWNKPSSFDVIEILTRRSLFILCVIFRTLLWIYGLPWVVQHTRSTCLSRHMAQRLLWYQVILTVLVHRQMAQQKQQGNTRVHLVFILIMRYVRGNPFFS